MLRAIAFCVVALLALPAFAAEEIPDGEMPAVGETAALYRAVTIVTGTRVETRLPGFAETLGDVLVNVTGDQTIRADRRLARAAKSAQALVLRFSYRDRLKGKPVHDEQGTHDRPHFLTVDFDPAKVDALAVELGRKPWPLPRPRVLMLVAVENIHNAFVLTRDGAIDRSADMREAVAAAAAKAALPPAVLPSEADLAARQWTVKTLDAVKPAETAALARADGAQAAVAGRIVFSEKALGWIVRWHMTWQARSYTWRTRGVNFDAAFRHALAGAAQVMAGRGAPR
ncbi:MAG TPA: DUF2066 domain-containing protein [Pseudolabrys sp.]|nr:DUF2066 domain-containing protein [Pseudolabrys sp.]